MASLVTNNALLLGAQGNLDEENDDIRILLISGDSVTPSSDLVHVEDVVADEHATATRPVVAGAALSINGTNDRVELTQTNVTFSALAADSEGTVKGFWRYRHQTDDSDSELLTWHEFDSPPTPNGADFIITIGSTGIVHFAGPTST